MTAELQMTFNEDEDVMFCFSLYEMMHTAVKKRAFKMYPKEYKLKMLAYKEKRIKIARRNVRFLTEKMIFYAEKGDEDMGFLALAMCERERGLIYFLEHFGKEKK